MPKEKPKTIKVRNRETDEIVHEVPIENPYRRSVDKVVRGMSINMNHDMFYIDDSAFDDLED